MAKVNSWQTGLVRPRGDRHRLEIRAIERAAEVGRLVPVELKNVDLPKEMQRAMGRQAEAERERRAKIIAAEGELQASQKLSEAAAVLASQPNALQLRYLQTLAEIATENSSTIVFPVPVDLLASFAKK